MTLRHMSEREGWFEKTWFAFWSKNRKLNFFGKQYSVSFKIVVTVQRVFWIYIQSYTWEPFRFCLKGGASFLLILIDQKEGEAPNTDNRMEFCSEQFNIFYKDDNILQHLQFWKYLVEWSCRENKYNPFRESSKHAL